MREGRRLGFLSLLLAAGCSPAPLAPRFERPPAPPEPVYRFPTGPEPTPGGGVAPDERAAPAPADALTLQKEIVARKPADEEKLRLALLLAAAGQWEEADRVLAGVKSPANKLAPYVDLFLKRQLGDHREAAKLLGRLAEEERTRVGFAIERAEVCSKVLKYRDYVPASGNTVKAGGTVLLYVEPRNFTLKREGERHILHLRYEWKLFEDQGGERPVAAWDGAPTSDREDRNVYAGPIRDFYQCFRLPLPADLPPGAYRIKVTVTDVPASRSDRVYVPVQVGAR